MRKTKNLKIFAITLATFCLSSLAQSYGVSLKAGESIERGRPISPNYVCNENIKSGHEVATFDNKGRNLYKKVVNIKKTYKKSDNSKNSDVQGEIDLELKFTYDKKSYVEVSSEDITGSKKSTKWKIRDLTEIIPSENNIVLVSSRYAAYKKGKQQGLGDYLMDSHIDVLCSSEGDIVVDTELS